MFVVSTIIGLISTFFSFLFRSSFYTDPGNIDLSPTLSLFCIPLVGVLAVAVLVISTGIQHAVSLALGGTGEFDRLVYLYAAISVPLQIVTGLLTVVMPPVAFCAAVPLSLYGLALNVLAVKTVHGFDWGRATLAVFWWIPLGLICCMLLAMFAGMGSGMMR